MKPYPHGTYWIDDIVMNEMDRNHVFSKPRRRPTKHLINRKNHTSTNGPELQGQNFPKSWQQNKKKHQQGIIGGYQDFGSSFQNQAQGGSCSKSKAQPSSQQHLQQQKYEPFVNSKTSQHSQWQPQQQKKYMPSVHFDSVDPNVMIDQVQPHQTTAMQIHPQPQTVAMQVQSQHQTTGMQVHPQPQTVAMQVQNIVVYQQSTVAQQPTHHHQYHHQIVHNQFSYSRTPSPIGDIHMYQQQTVHNQYSTHPVYPNGSVCVNDKEQEEKGNPDAFYEVLQTLASEGYYSPIIEVPQSILKMFDTIYHPKIIDFLGVHEKLAFLNCIVFDKSFNIVSCNQEAKTSLRILPGQEFNENGELFNRSRGVLNLFAMMTITSAVFEFKEKYMLMSKIAEALKGKSLQFLFPFMDPRVNKFFAGIFNYRCHDNFLIGRMISKKELTGTPADISRQVQTLRHNFGRRLLLLALRHEVPVKPEIQSLFPDIFPIIQKLH